MMRPPTTTTITIEMGSRTFQATYMSWSTRSRGSVQRSHIMMKTRNQALAISHTGPRPMGPICCRMPFGKGEYQPPRNSTEATAEMTNISVYSAMKNMAKKNPLYSVWNPATSSLSASGMSKGVRLHSARPAVKKMTKATGMIGK